MDFLDILNSIVNAIKEVLNFFSIIGGLIIDMLNTLFTTFPSFISIGFSFIFAMGLFILIVKLVRG